MITSYFSLGVDLALLSFSDHSIMTYGTFGIWGSLLGKEDKLTIFPKEFMKTDKEYESLFEPNLQKPPESVKDGTYGSKYTLVFYTGLGTDFMDRPLMDQMNLRDMKKDKGDIMLKFHQANQIPHLLENSRLQSYFSVPSIIF